MSLDLFVSFETQVDRKRVVDILHRGASLKDAGAVRYPDDSGAFEICGLDDDDCLDGLVGNLCFRRFGGRLFLERLYEIADRLDARILWAAPDDDLPFVGVTRTDLLHSLPEEFDRTFAVVLRDADHLQQTIAGPFKMANRCPKQIFQNSG